MQGLSMIVFLSLVLGSFSAVLITEIMYNPRTYASRFQYLELFNDGAVAVSVAGWTIPAINYTIPAGSSIGPSQYVIISKDPPAMRWAYADYPTTGAFNGVPVWGPFLNGDLASSGENVTLVDTTGTVVFYVDYKTRDNWNMLADGFGSSLELMCYQPPPPDNFDKGRYWTASPPPQRYDKHLEWGGTPGQPPRWKACLLEGYTDPKVKFSEVMYSPYKSNWYGEKTEFLEIKNNETFPVDVSSWMILAEDGMRFVFPTGTILAAGELVTIARDPTIFRTYYTGAQVTGRIFGPWEADLPNSATKLIMVDTNSREMDSLIYDIKGGFPLAADSLGGDNDTLPTNSPFMQLMAGGYYDVKPQYLFKGQSLTRRSWQWTTDHGYNWYAADPSPGRDNLDTNTPLLPTITSVDQTPTKKSIIAGSAVVITINLRPMDDGVLSSIPNITNVQMRWWVYNPITGTSGTQNTVNMVFDGQHGFNGTIPAQTVGTVVRYTVTINWVGGRTTAEPLLADPFRWHSIFWDPEPYGSITGTSGIIETFHVFIKPADWDKIITNAINGRAYPSPNDCVIRESWQDRVPCVLVHKGDVYDAQIRLQGSRYNRDNGIPVSNAWPGFAAGVAPSASFKVYSYRIDLPAQEEIDGNQAFILQKLYQGCTMYQTPLMNRVSDALGILAPEYYFARVRFNGFFLRYMLVVQHGGSAWIKRGLRILQARCMHQSIEEVGDVWKARGFTGTEGPYVNGNFQQFPSGPPNCPMYNSTVAYQYTYSRTTYQRLDHSELILFINGLQTASSSGTVRAFLTSNLDLNSYGSYFAIDSYAQSWDHTIHNQFIHRRLSDDKFSWLPWDADRMFGESAGGNPWNTGGNQWSPESHRVKTEFNNNFGTEIQQRMRLLLATTFLPANMNALLTNIYKEFDTTQGAASDAWAPFGQNFGWCRGNLSNYVANRPNAYIPSIFAAYSGNSTTEFNQISCPSKATLTKIYNSFTSQPGPSLPPFLTFDNVTTRLVFQMIPGNPQGNPIVSFIILAQVNGVGLYSQMGPSINPAADGTGVYSFDNTTGLIPGNNYSFVIRTVNALGQSVQSNPRTFNMPRNCAFTNWSNYSTCTLTCGFGNWTRTRSTIIALNGGLACIGNLTETATCNAFECPIDCTWNNWTNFTVCDKVCGNGTQYRNRTQNVAQFGGANCTGPDSEVQFCNTQPCPLDCTWNPWIPGPPENWTNCTVLCGGGTQYRNRTSNLERNGGKPCTGVANEEQACNTQPCPIDCKWTAWSNWSACSITCANGTQIRTRTQNPPAQFGGIECNGTDNETQVCVNPICPIDCEMEEWSDWSNCSAICGGGTQYRNRTDNGGPLYGGKNCTEPRIYSEVQDCNPDPCNFDCTWNDWTNWTECSKVCDTGVTYRNRTLNPPMGTGKPCDGAFSEEQACNEVPCGDDCTWNPWSDWTECDKVCGTGVSFRNRTQNPPKNNGVPCIGEFSEEEKCNTDACGPNCTWNPWKAWSPCNASCDSGWQFRNRTKNPEIPPDGVPCEGEDYEIQSCYTNIPCGEGCVWDDWSDWAYCCGPNSTTYRNRTIAKEGVPCLGESSETDICGLPEGECRGDKGGLSTGAIIGIVIGSVVAAALLIALLALLAMTAFASEGFEQV